MKVGIYTEALGDYISGGILCIVEVLNKLSERGHEVCAFVDHAPYTSNWIPAKFPVLPSESQDFDRFDGVLVSSFSPTAKAVAFHSRASERMYWVHTNEALFCHNGPEWSQRAHESYSLPLKLFATSHYVRILLEMQYRRKVIGTLVPPGVDPATFNILYRERLGWNVEDGDPVRVLVFGRNDACRGVDIALHGVNIARQSGVDIVGKAVPNGIRSRKDLAKYYQWADLFIDTSRLAGCPTPPKEAMACGCVPIVTPYGATDFVLDGSNGYVVPVDDPQAVANAIKAYTINWSDNGTYQLCCQNRDYIHDHFSWDKIADRFESAVNEAARRGDELLENKQW